MDRRNFIKLGASAGALSPALSSARSQKKRPLKLIASHPIALNPKADRMTIAWRISERCKGYVEFGTDSDQLTQVQEDDSWGLRPSGEKHIIVALRNLTPDTLYHYRVVTETFDKEKPQVEKSKIYSFQTLSEDADNAHFTVWNDTHKRNDTLKALCEHTSPKTSFMLWNGDISNDWHSANDIPESVLSPAGLKIPFPVHPLRGNHDMRGAYAADFRDYVTASGEAPWSAIRVGPIAILCLDTGEDKADSHPYLFNRVACDPMRQAQVEWLEEVIQTPSIKNAPYKVVCCHIPLRWTNEQKDYGYDYFSKRSRDLWHEALVKWGAQIIISGHTHRIAYLESSPEFPYAQLIGGGPKKHQATLIECSANLTSMKILSKKLDGSTVHSLTVKPS